MATGLAARAICAKIPNRSFIRVTGKNSAQLLNGLITTTVPWPPSNGFYSAFLAASVFAVNVYAYLQLTFLHTGKNTI